MAFVQEMQPMSWTMWKVWYACPHIAIRPVIPDICPDTAGLIYCPRVIMIKIVWNDFNYRLKSGHIRQKKRRGKDIRHISCSKNPACYTGYSLGYCRISFFAPGIKQNGFDKSGHIRQVAAGYPAHLMLAASFTISCVPCMTNWQPGSWLTLKGWIKAYTHIHTSSSQCTHTPLPLQAQFIHAPHHWFTHNPQLNFILYL